LQLHLQARCLAPDAGDWSEASGPPPNVSERTSPTHCRRTSGRSRMSGDQYRHNPASHAGDRRGLHPARCVYSIPDLIAMTRRSTMRETRM
jgi:hypothetical protein